MPVIQLLLGIDKVLNCFLCIDCLPIFSWKRDTNGSVVCRPMNGHEHLKQVLEFVAIRRRDIKQWALPGVR